MAEQTFDPQAQRRVLGIFQPQQFAYAPSGEVVPLEEAPKRPDTTAAAMKGFISELSFGAYEPEFKTDAEKFAAMGGELIGMGVTASMLFKAVKAAQYSKRLAAGRTLAGRSMTPFQEGLVDTAVTASIYRASHGAARQEDPSKILREVPGEIAAWETFFIAGSGAVKFGKLVRDWWRGRGELKLDRVTDDQWAKHVRWLHTRTADSKTPDWVKPDVVAAIEQMPGNVRSTLVKRGISEATKKMRAKTVDEWAHLKPDAAAQPPKEKLLIGMSRKGKPIYTDKPDIDAPYDIGKEVDKFALEAPIEDILNASQKEWWELAKNPPAYGDKPDTRGMLDEKGAINIDWLKKFFKKNKGIAETTGKVESHGRMLFEAQTPEALRIHTMHENAKKANEALEKIKDNAVKRTARKLITGTQDNILAAFSKLPDSETVRRARALFVNIRGATPSAQMKGEALDKAIWGDLDSVEEEQLTNIIHSRRVVQIDANVIKKHQADVQKELAKIAEKPQAQLPGMPPRPIEAVPKTVKHPEGTTGDEHAKYLQSLTDDGRERLMPKADMFFKAHQEMLVLLNENGILGDKELESLLASGDYSMRRFLKHIDPTTYEFRHGGRTISVSRSGFKPLEDGDISHLDRDIRAQLQYKIASTENIIFRNRANGMMWQLANETPNNGIVRTANVVGMTKKGKPIHEDTPPGFTSIHYMKDGIPHKMFMPSEIAAEWTTSDPIMNQMLSETISWLTGAKFVRATATGALNPFYSLVGMPMDLTHIYISQNQYSSFLPKYIAEMSGDIKAVWKDVWNETGDFKEFVEQGGMMNFFYQQGKFHSPWLPKDWQRDMDVWQEAMTRPNAFTEILLRVAHYHRGKRLGLSPEEAVYETRRRMDFGDGSQITRWLDQPFPYTNAGAMAIKGTATAGKEDPGKFAWKVAQIALASIALANTNRIINYKGYNQLRKTKPYEIENNFILMLPSFINHVDKKGETHYFYFKIRKDPIGRGVSTLFDNLTGMTIWDENFDEDSVKRSMTGMAPWMPLQSSFPTLNAFLGYSANKRLFGDVRDIWNGMEVEAKHEYIPGKTHPLARKWGEATGLSPERSTYALQQYLSASSPYVFAGAGTLRVIMNELGEDYESDPEADFITSFMKWPGIKSIIGMTGPGLDVHKAIEEESKRAGSSKKPWKDMADVKSKKFMQGELSQQELDQFIETVPESYRLGIAKRIEMWKYNSERFASTPIGRSGWYRLLNMKDGAARARAYIRELKEVRRVYGMDEMKRMEKIAEETPGFKNDRSFAAEIEILLEEKRRGQE